ncbi:MAG: DUF2130 domain-containing protein [Chitinophagaceae bacterium]
MPLITCPGCQHQFEPNDAIRDELQKELRSKMVDWQKKKDDEFQAERTALQQQLLAKDADAAKTLETEKKKLATVLETDLRKQITGDFSNQITMLQQQKAESDERLKTAREKELAFLQKEQELLHKESQLEITVQQMLLQRSSSLREEIQKQETERVQLKETEFQFKLKEMEEKLEAQRKLADEMKRRAEQGSMQSQGEAQELVLEDILRSTFPFDLITEVGKGVRGADCIQLVRNSFGQECGRIIFESKRTQDFSEQWIDKIKADMRSQGADVAVIVTQALPKKMDRFGERDGVYICSFGEVKAIVHMLRAGIIKLSTALKSQENRGDKMHLLYTYLTSSEFAEQWKAIREGFMGMRLSIQKERDAMERLWKAREKQLEKVLLNAAHIRGSIDGIAGMDTVDLNLLDDVTAEITE